MIKLQNIRVLRRRYWYAIYLKLLGLIFFQQQTRLQILMEWLNYRLKISILLNELSCGLILEHCVNRILILDISPYTYMLRNEIGKDV